MSCQVGPPIRVCFCREGKNKKGQAQMHLTQKRSCLMPTWLIEFMACSHSASCPVASVHIYLLVNKGALLAISKSDLPHRPFPEILFFSASLRFVSLSLVAFCLACVHDQLFAKAPPPRRSDFAASLLRLPWKQSAVPRDAGADRSFPLVLFVISREYPSSPASFCQKKSEQI